jgi:alpha-glucosidase (family GH31 glycosyl hydrolase)
MSDDLLTATSRVFVRFLAPQAVRITHAPATSSTPPAERPWFQHIFLPQAPVSPEQRQLQVTLINGCVQIAHNQHVICTEAAAPQLSENTVQLQFAMRSNEGFYGGGEWFNGFRRQHGTLTLDSRESQAHNQHRQTYSNIPFFLSSAGYGLFLLNTHRSTWQFGTPQHQTRTLTISALGPPADYLVIYGPEPTRILETYTALTGRPPLLPHWAFGLWATGYPQEPQQIVEERVAEHHRRAIPLDGVILDYHWQTGLNALQWRKALFPNPDELIKRLKSYGTRLGLIFTPFINRANNWRWRYLLQLLFRNVSAGQLHTDERDRTNYAAAQERGLFAHPNTWWWLGSGGMLDFSNPATVAWWNERLRPLYQQGVVLFKNDDGEYLPDDGHSTLGLDGAEYHNVYGFFYGRAIYDGMTELDNRRPMIYARSVWAGSQRYPALFLGDQKPTFHHIRATIRAGLNMSLLGFAYWTPDVFGLDGRTTPETHMRYAQWALLAPVARYFWRPPAIDNTRLPWSHGPEAEANFRAYTVLRYRLLPYLISLAWQAYQTGLPIVRPLFFAEDRPELQTIDDQVLLGPNLLLAPVVQAKATERTITLPSGEWHDFWSTTSYAGACTISYPAPRDRLPILIRGGSIIPFGPALQQISDNHRLDRLELHCWPPYPVTTTIYDDDGTTRTYQEGQVSTTQIDAVGDATQITLTLHPASGASELAPAQRHVEIVLQRSQKPQRATCNDKEIAWSYHVEVQQTRLIVTDQSAETTIIQVFL